MSNKNLSYSKSGVSISRGDRFVEAIGPLARKTHRKEVVSSIGGFAASVLIPSSYKKPLLITSTDGVGTKVLLAKKCRKYSTVGIDLVAMSVNDILTIGAEPLVFLDYFATSRIDIEVGKNIVSGIAQGCCMAGCALVGGETAEMPQVYKSGDFDLAGFCVGVVEKDKVVDGRSVKPGDVIIGIPSNGIHSNGYSLVRMIVQKRRLSLTKKYFVGHHKTFGEELLAPTRIYVSEVLQVLKKITPHAMAHITGGGIPGNLPRMFPDGCGAEIDRSRWEISSVFKFLQSEGNVKDKEMFDTFNMGIGFTLVVSSQDVSQSLRMIPDARVIGKVVKKMSSPRVVFK